MASQQASLLLKLDSNATQEREAPPWGQVGLGPSKKKNGGIK